MTQTHKSVTCFSQQHHLNENKAVLTQTCALWRSRKQTRSTDIYY